jgi:DNA mismatch repair protein MutS
VLSQLEADHRDAFDRPTIQTPGSSSGSGQYQLTLFGFADHPLLEDVQKLDLDGMTPIEAMQFLQQAQQKLTEKAEKR